MEKAKSTEIPRLTNSIKRTANILDMGQTKVWDLVKKGQLEVVRIGGRTLVLSDSIGRLIESLRIAPTQARKTPRKCAKAA